MGPDAQVLERELVFAQIEADSYPILAFPQHVPHWLPSQANLRYCTIIDSWQLCIRQVLLLLSIDVNIYALIRI